MSATGLVTADTRTLQQQAVERARSAFGALADGDALFAQVNTQNDVVAEMLKTLKLRYGYHRNKRRTIVEKFEKYTRWMQNLTGVFETLAQTQAGIACPIWAPIKLVLQVGHLHSLFAVFSSAELGLKLPFPSGRTNSGHDRSHLV